VLQIDSLCIEFRQERARVAAVRDVSLALAPGECVGVVGESGSGKTQTFLAAMGLLGRNALVSGSIRFEGRELLAAATSELNRVRGARLAMIFQDPMTSLTPHLTVGVQMAEVLVCHAGLSWTAAKRKALDMLQTVRIADAARRMRQYPHELSGGMRQRVMIGMSLLCEPALVIADEPTSALDATIHVQVIELLAAMRREFRMAIALISHDLCAVHAMADRVVVMYAGRVVECAPATAIFAHPRHPYTAELLRCAPNLSAARLNRMPSITGQPPDPAEVLPGCAFAARCARADARCRIERPLLVQSGGAAQAACHHPL